MNQEEKISNENNQEQILLKNAESQEQNLTSIERRKNSSDEKQRKFKYELLKDYENFYGSSFVFNQDTTKIFIAQGQDIKVYEFKNGEIQNELQTLSKHKDSIFGLILLNKSNLLVSGSWDNSMVIWSQDQNGSWKAGQTLEGHQDQINCLISNENEDLLISGSKDETIKFWKKMSTNWYCSQTIQTKCKVLSLSLNKSQTKLISCGDGSKDIIVMELKSQQWVIIQQIQVGCFGNQLCFISDNQFIFQGQQANLQIYHQQGQKQFILEKQIPVQKAQWEYLIYYPCSFFEPNILMIKNGSYLNLFAKDENQNYYLQQSFEFSDDYFFGNISKDGQFLITYDGDTQSIQVRKLSYQE